MIRSLYARQSARMYLVLLAAFALRVIALNGRPMWYDEAFAVLYAEKSFAAMWYGTVTLVQGAAADVHPLFFYSLLHAWMGLVGQSPFAVRFMSVAFGVATVALVYRLALALFGRRVALIAGAMTALAPFHIAYSQEARMYAQLGLFGTLALYAFVRFEQARTRRWWLVFVLGSAGAVYSHNLGFVFLILLGVWVTWRAIVRRDSDLFKGIALAGVSIFAIWSAWLVLVPSQFGKVQQAYWVPPPSLISILQTLLTFVADYDNAQMPAALLPFALFAALLLALLFVYQVLRRRSDQAWLAIVVGLGTPAVLLLLSQWRPVYVTRALMVAFLMLLVGTAWALAGLPKPLRRSLYAALVALAAASLVPYYSYAQFPRPPFREAAGFLRTEASAGDAVVHDNKLSFFPMHYYDRQCSQTFVADPAGGGSDTLALPTQEALQLFASSLDKATEGRSRVWFVIFRQAVEQGSGNLVWMSEHYRSSRVREFNDLLVYLYEK